MEFYHTALSEGDTSICIGLKYCQKCWLGYLLVYRSMQLSNTMQFIRDGTLLILRPVHLYAFFTAQVANVLQWLVTCETLCTCITSIHGQQYRAVKKYNNNMYVFNALVSDWHSLLSSGIGTGIKKEKVVLKHLYFPNTFLQMFHNKGLVKK